MKFNRVWITHNCLVLEHGPDTYEIELNRINTPRKACFWLVHLLEKGWITPGQLLAMVHQLEDHFGYSLHGPLV